MQDVVVKETSKLVFLNNTYCLMKILIFHENAEYLETLFLYFKTTTVLISCVGKYYKNM